MGLRLSAAFLMVSFIQIPGARADEGRVKVFVSVLPQAMLVERVGGKHVEVAVMVQPGHSPATYEPTPRQLAELSRARIYFRVGAPFESGVIDNKELLNTLEWPNAEKVLHRSEQKMAAGSAGGGDNANVSR